MDYSAPEKKDDPEVSATLLVCDFDSDSGELVVRGREEQWGRPQDEMALLSEVRVPNSVAIPSELSAALSEIDQSDPFAAGVLVHATGTKERFEIPIDEDPESPDEYMSMPAIRVVANRVEVSRIPNDIGTLDAAEMQDLRTFAERAVAAAQVACCGHCKSSDGSMDVRVVWAPSADVDQFPRAQISLYASNLGPFGRQHVWQAPSMGKVAELMRSDIREWLDDLGVINIEGVLDRGDAAVVEAPKEPDGDFEHLMDVIEEWGGSDAQQEDPSF